MLKPPPKRNPLAVLHPTPLPPAARSRAALGLTAQAARGIFALQVCDSCAAVQYPPRDICGNCLSHHLTWKPVPDGAIVIAETKIRISADPYFRTKTPWRVGTVQLDCGPSVVAHLHEAVAPGDRARMALKLDKSGQGVMLALPETGTGTNDHALHEMTCDPRDRRVLVTDARSPFGQAVAVAMVAAGARVFAGIADPWKPFPGRDKLDAAGIETIDLDITDTENVHRAAAAFGGRIEILVNTALHIRPGGIITRGDVVLASEEVETTQLGLMRLAQHFGPALRGRGADGPNPACAWVNILSANALMPDPKFGATAATHAAALSLSRTLRAELQPGGIRVIDAFVGPLDDVWHEALPPPKVTPAALAAAIVRALRDGVEETAIGEVAQDILARFHENPKILERELATP